MNDAVDASTAPSREWLLHALYEAAELEHNLMCTYLYAAFSLKGAEDGLPPDQAQAVAGWRRVVLDVAVEEMGHLAAVWNITVALGGAPRFGRGNFPLDPGLLPAGVVVRLAPFSADVLQHFIHLERPHDAAEPDGPGFAEAIPFARGGAGARLTPMAMDYETVGDFYAAIGRDLRALVEQVGEENAFCGNPALQLSQADIALAGVQPVRCLRTALAAFDTIVAQGEGATADNAASHFQKFLRIRTEYTAILANDPAFQPAHPAAHNPVLRRPPRAEGRVWIEDSQAVHTVDLANAAYQLMLRLMAYAFTLPAPNPERSFAINAGIELMRIMTLLGEHAARLPAGPSHPGCNAGVSFTALRDSASLPVGQGARQFLRERFAELAQAAATLAGTGAARTARAADLLRGLSERAGRTLSAVETTPGPAPTAAPTRQPAPAPRSFAADGAEVVEGTDLTLSFNTKRCIHARFCVTGAPDVFLANVQGPWIHPDAMPVESLAAIAHVCPSGAITYHRKDGGADETAPPVNLAAIREAGPYAFRGALLINGAPAGFRATLCRCGASHNKPYCDGSHHDVGFAASGEPATGATDALAVRNGPLAIDPQTDGPLAVTGNLEITSGTGRVVARVQGARLCRCGGSGTKPFCDGTHARIGFRAP